LPNRTVYWQLNRLIQQGAVKRQGRGIYRITYAGLERFELLTGRDLLERQDDGVHQIVITPLERGSDVAGLLYFVRPTQSIGASAGSENVYPRKDLHSLLFGADWKAARGKLTEALNQFIAFYLYPRADHVVVMIDDETFIVHSVLAKGLTSTAITELTKSAILKGLPH
jgi:hypothetical protein